MRPLFEGRGPITTTREMQAEWFESIVRCGLLADGTSRMHALDAARALRTAEQVPPIPYLRFRA